ncbi:cytochrome P450 4F4-like [Saccoglossus kowalevskii]
MAYDMLKPWLGDGLLLSKGSKWFRNRKLLTPGFHFDVLKPYAKIFNECSKALVCKWHGENNSIEVFHDVSLLTLDCLMKCIFSHDSQNQDGDSNSYTQSVYQAGTLFSKRFLNLLHHSDSIYHLSSNGRKWRKALKILHSHSSRVIKQRHNEILNQKENGVSNKRKYIDFLDILLSARDEDGNGLTDKEIQDEVDTFMFEGHDTTSSGISWCMYNLAKHAEYQQKCQQEIDEYFSKKGSKDLEWDDLHNLPYLTLCIKESLRINPAVPFIGRSLTKALYLPDGRFLPAGMSITINIYGLHHNNTVWDNPEVYDPSRFLPENVKDRSPHAYVPFSAGPRNCIGQNFAMSELKIVMATILHNFDLSVDTTKQINSISEMVYKTRNGMFLFITKRRK